MNDFPARLPDLTLSWMYGILPAGPLSAAVLIAAAALCIATVRRMAMRLAPVPVATTVVELPAGDGQDAEAA